MEVQTKRNMIEEQKIKTKRMKRLGTMTNSVIWKVAKESRRKTYWLGVLLPSVLYGANVMDMKWEDIENNSESNEWAAQAAISGEIGVTAWSKENQGTSCYIWEGCKQETRY